MTELTTSSTDTFLAPAKTEPTPAKEETKGPGAAPASPSKSKKNRPKHMATARRQTKASKVEALLTRKSGVTLEQMCEATNWQAHSCRAFISGLRKKGLDIVRKTGKAGKSTYRFGPANSAAKAR